MSQNLGGGGHPGGSQRNSPTAGRPTEQLDGRQRELDAHAAAMEAAFRRSQAARHSQWDLWAGASLSVLLMLALPSSLQRPHWQSQLAAVAVEVGMRLGPACLAWLAWDRYQPRRTFIVVACRLASVALPRLRLHQSLPAGHSWGGWPQFLLHSHTLAANTLPWLTRLPFKWFVWVHLMTVVDAARLSMVTVCSCPAFNGVEAQQRYALATRVARFLSMLAPIPSQQAPAGGGSCLERLLAVDGGAQSNGPCACRQMVAYVLACLGYVLPLAVQFVVEAAARARFYRRHCRQPRCEVCAATKGTDLLMLPGTLLLLFASFCAVAWQLAAGIFVPDSAAATLAAVGDTAGPTTQAACPNGL